MTFTRNLWKETYYKYSIGPFLCPRCRKGSVKLDAKTLKMEEPQYSKAGHASEEWSPDWDVERFSCFLRCDHQPCQEIVVVSGETINEQVIVDDQDGSQGWGVETYLRPSSMFPAPPIIAFPKELPKAVSAEVNKSFGLFWVDRDACATSLRKSVEVVLDEVRIPRIEASGKFIDLKTRIDEFKKIDPDNDQALDALRIVGNLATHEGGVSWEALLDAYMIYEDALLEIFGKRKAKIEATIKKLIASKGKY